MFESFKATTLFNITEKISFKTDTGKHVAERSVMYFQILTCFYTQFTEQLSQSFIIYYIPYIMYYMVYISYMHNIYIKYYNPIVHILYTCGKNVDDGI